MLSTVNASVNLDFINLELEAQPYVKDVPLDVLNV